MQNRRICVYVLRKFRYMAAACLTANESLLIVNLKVSVRFRLWVGCAKFATD